jgi:hypothetical protein
MSSFRSANTSLSVSLTRLAISSFCCCERPSIRRGRGQDPRRTTSARCLVRVWSCASCSAIRPDVSSSVEAPDEAAASSVSSRRLFRTIAMRRSRSATAGETAALTTAGRALRVAAAFFPGSRRLRVFTAFLAADRCLRVFTAFRAAAMDLRVFPAFFAAAFREPDFDAAIVPSPTSKRGAMLPESVLGVLRVGAAHAEGRDGDRDLSSAPPDNRKKSFRRLRRSIPSVVRGARPG